MRYAWFALAALVVAVVSILGLRGTPRTRPPLEVFPDMDRQPKYKPQAESRFFADGRTERPVPAGVVARGRSAAADPAFGGLDGHFARGYRGALLAPEATDWCRGFPDSVVVDRKLMARGQERYGIFCAPCHGALGDGNGITKLYGMGATPSYHQDRLRGMAEGEIFATITNGKNSMLGYGDRLAEADRWAVIAYVRALQRAQQGSLDDVPAAHRAELQP